MSGHQTQQQQAQFQQSNFQGQPQQPQQTQSPHPATQVQQTLNQAQSQILSPTQAQLPPLKTELKTEIEEEPTDLSTHTHCNGNLTELQLSVKSNDYQQSSQAEDLSLSHTQPITADVS